MERKKKYTLVGVDGNAFCIMGYVRNAMSESGFSRDEISEYTEDAMSSDYNHLIAVSVDMIDKCNFINIPKPGVQAV